mmetsp:Transcript_6588/g.10051  ORF Transcript_6588/g.10051 Transcript_6588/m.10051 type:complete len:237 (+) Transcript_6588:93-803(+)
MSSVWKSLFEDLNEEVRGHCLSFVTAGELRLLAGTNRSLRTCAVQAYCRRLCTSTTSSMTSISSQGGPQRRIQSFDSFQDLPNSWLVERSWRFPRHLYEDSHGYDRTFPNGTQPPVDGWFRQARCGKFTVDHNDNLAYWPVEWKSPASLFFETKQTRLVVPPEFHQRPIRVQHCSVAPTCSSSSSRSSTSTRRHILGRNLIPLGHANRLHIIVAVIRLTCAASAGHGSVCFDLKKI